MPGLTASLDASPFPKELAPGSNWGRIEEGFSIFATQETSHAPKSHIQSRLVWSISLYFGHIFRPFWASF